jgi:hypothetical protein
MLNHADPIHDDRTIRRCIGFARHWGHGGIVVVNLFALRATNPAELARAVDPVGPENDAAVRSHTEGLRVIAAWGNKGTLLGRSDAVLQLLEDCNVECLGVTSAGQPRHPLYLASDAVPVLLQRGGSFDQRR